MLQVVLQVLPPVLDDGLKLDHLLLKLLPVLTLGLW